jgi:hypothetical protein
MTFGDYLTYRGYEALIGIAFGVVILPIYLFLQLRESKKKEWWDL